MKSNQIETQETFKAENYTSLELYSVNDLRKNIYLNIKTNESRL